MEWHRYKPGYQPSHYALAGLGADVHKLAITSQRCPPLRSSVFPTIPLFPLWVTRRCSDQELARGVKLQTINTTPRHHQPSLLFTSSNTSQGNITNTQNHPGRHLVHGSTAPQERKKSNQLHSYQALEVCYHQEYTDNLNGTSCFACKL